MIRELYLNVELKGNNNGAKLYYDFENNSYQNLYHNSDDSYFSINEHDVDIFIKAGIIREILPKIYDKQDIVNILFQNYRISHEVIRKIINDYDEQKESV